MSQEQIAKILAKYGMTGKPVVTADTVIQTKKWDCTHASLMNIPLIVIKFEDIKTSYGEAKLALCIVEGDEKQVLMGGTVLVQQLEEVADQLPMQATIRKVGKYYSFV